MTRSSSQPQAVAPVVRGRTHGVVRSMPPAHGYSSYAEAQCALDGDVPAWVLAMRAQGMETFRQLGFPTTRVEDWKYTDTSLIARESFCLPARDQHLPVWREAWEQHALPGCAVRAFDRGRHVPTVPTGHDLSSVVRVLPLRQALLQDESIVRAYLGHCAPAQDSFTALNQAFLEDGIFVLLPAGVKLVTPVQLLFVGGYTPRATMTCPRNLIVVGEAAELELLEWWVGSAEAPFLTNAVTEIVLAANARLRHVRYTEEHGSMLHMGRVAVRQARNSVYTSQVMTFGGAWTRVEIHTTFDAEGASATLDGLYIAAGQSLVDHHTTIDHQRGHTTSRQLYKGVLDGAARGVFNGKVYVRPGALKSDAQQMNKNLLLADDAEVDTKPQLEIFADDVKCSHGAAIGQLDEDALFYLRARGIDRAEARQLLIFAFAHEIVERVPGDNVQRRLRQALRARLVGAPEEDPS